MPVDGDVLRAWRRVRGWDVPEMERRLRRAAGDDPVPVHDAFVRMVRRWERQGLRTERYELLYAAALGISPDELAAGPGGNGFSNGVELSNAAGPARRSVLAGGVLAAGMLSIGPEARERLAWAARNPPRIDVAAVAALADVLAAQRRTDDLLGSTPVLQPALTQLAAVEDLMRQARGPARPALVDVAQQWAEFAAWLCRNTGDPGQARALYAQTIEWATEAGDKTMIVTALVHKCDMAAQAGEVGTVLGLAQAAQRDPVVATGQRALAAGLEARGHAMAGDGQAAERKLGDAHHLVGILADRPEDQRPWSYWLSATYFQNEEGITYGHLAGQRGYYQRAVSLLERGYPQVADKDRPTWAAGSLVHLADVHALAGDVGEACAAAVKASHAARLSGSPRLTAMLDGVHAWLRAHYPNDRRVVKLGEALR